MQILKKINFTSAIKGHSSQITLCLNHKCVHKRWHGCTISLSSKHLRFVIETDGISFNIINMHYVRFQANKLYSWFIEIGLRSTHHHFPVAAKNGLTQRGSLIAKIAKREMRSLQSVELSQCSIWSRRLYKCHGDKETRGQGQCLQNPYKRTHKNVAV